MDPQYVQWLRPKEIKGCENPVLFADGVSAGDIIQGRLVGPPPPCEHADLGVQHDVHYRNMLCCAATVCYMPCCAATVLLAVQGDCWFLSALSCLATQPDLLQNLFVSEKYAKLGMCVRPLGARARSHACIHAHACTHARAHIHVHACINAQAHAHTRTRSHTPLRVRACMHTRPCSGLALVDTWAPG
jgi:hypothetical protein